MVAALLSGYLGVRPQHVKDLIPGTGMIADVGGEKLAVHRDDAGALHAVSAKCTHMGCVVGWNPVDCTWDCGCHGSRFARDGSVLHGPAVTPLEKKKAPAA
jgi:Rieske Fe-S protein